MEQSLQEDARGAGSDTDKALHGLYHPAEERRRTPQERSEPASDHATPHTASLDRSIAPDILCLNCSYTNDTYNKSTSTPTPATEARS